MYYILWDGTFFPLLHMYCALLASVRSKYSACRGSLLIDIIYIYIYIYIYIISV